jgi:hypothetical protein
LRTPVPRDSGQRPQFSYSSAFRPGTPRSDSSGADSSITGSLILYFSLAQFPKSNKRQRSLQKRKSGDVSESVGLRQMGQFRFTTKAYRGIAISREPEAILYGFDARMGNSIFVGSKV